MLPVPDTPPEIAARQAAWPTPWEAAAQRLAAEFTLSGQAAPNHRSHRDSAAATATMPAAGRAPFSLPPSLSGQAVPRGPTASEAPPLHGQAIPSTPRFLVPYPPLQGAWR